MPIAGYTPSYISESPYGRTPVIGSFMSYYIHRSVDPQPDDILVTIDDKRYVGRPDRLANDYYGDPNLWWVFGVRNGWEDPMHDLKFGITAYISPDHYVRSIL